MHHAMAAALDCTICLETFEKPLVHWVTAYNDKYFLCADCAGAATCHSMVSMLANESLVEADSNGRKTKICSKVFGKENDIKESRRAKPH